MLLAIDLGFIKLQDSVTGTSDQRYEPTLAVRIAVDVPLGRHNRSVASEQLHVSQRAASLMHAPGRAGDERPPTRMRRAASEADGPVRLLEPVDDTDRVHRTAARRSNDRPRRDRACHPPSQGVVKVRVDWDQPAALVLRGRIAKLNDRGEIASRIQNHVPRQLRYLSGSQPSFDREEDN